MTNVTRAAPLRTPHNNVGANPTAIGNTAIVAAEANARFRVLGLAMVSVGANSVKFQSNASDITATFALAANGGVVLPFNEHGWFETLPGEALNVNLSAATAVGVQVHYIKLLS